MATEHGTAGHLRAGWRMAMVGLWWGLLGLAAEGVGALLFGDAADWWGNVVAVPLWMAAFGVGGVLYSLFLPASVRRQSASAAWARARTGALAGAMTGGLAAVASTLTAPVHAPLALGLLVGLALAAAGALIGGVFGFLASLHARSGAQAESRAGTGGIGGSPHLADPS